MSNTPVNITNDNKDNLVDISNGLPVSIYSTVEKIKEYVNNTTNRIVDVSFNTETSTLLLQGNLNNLSVVIPSGGSDYTAANGISIVSDVIRLGGVLNAPTTITFDSSTNPLTFKDVSAAISNYNLILEGLNTGSIQSNPNAKSLVTSDYVMRIIPQRMFNSSLTGGSFTITKVTEANLLYKFLASGYEQVYLAKLRAGDGIDLFKDTLTANFQEGVRIAKKPPVTIGHNTEAFDRAYTAGVALDLDSTDDMTCLLNASSSASPTIGAPAKPSFIRLPAIANVPVGREYHIQVYSPTSTDKIVLQTVSSGVKSLWNSKSSPYPIGIDPATDNLIDQLDINAGDYVIVKKTNNLFYTVSKQ